MPNFERMKLKFATIFTKNCEKLINVVIPGNTGFVGVGAFGKDTNLTKLEIPNNTTTFAYGAFEDCTNLKDIYFTGSKEDFNNNLSISDYDKNFLKNITIHYDFFMPKSVDSETKNLTTTTRLLQRIVCLFRDTL